MMKMENFQKLLELKKDLTGIDNLAIRGRVRLFTVAVVVFMILYNIVHIFALRGDITCKTVKFMLVASPSVPPMFVLDFQEFIRLGCLSKLSGKGLQQRMFFLVRTYSC